MCGGGVLAVTLASAMEPQVNVPLVTQMNRLPSPLNIPNWKQDALDYSQFIFDRTVTGSNMPAVQVSGQDFAFPGYLYPYGPYRASNDVYNTEAMTSVAPVIAAELLGMDMTTYKGLNWVQSCKRWFDPGFGPHGLYRDGPSQTGGGGLLNGGGYGYWPMALGMMLTDRHRSDAVFSTNLSLQCASVLQIAQAFGCPTNANFGFSYQYDLDTRSVTNVIGGWNPGSSTGLGWMLYVGYLWTGDTNYLACAQSAVQFYLGYPGRFENAHQYGPLVLARLNAEQGMAMDLGRMMDNFFGDHTRMPLWIQNPPDGYYRHNWSVARGWSPGGVQADGLDIDSRQDGGVGYAFTMGSYQNTAWLTPVARYDQRFARNIGRFLLNAANSCRLLRGIDLDWNQQDNLGWRTNLIYHGVNKGFLFSYEGLRWESHYADPSGATHAPYATGDWTFNSGVGFGSSPNPAADYWNALTNVCSYVPPQPYSSLSYFQWNSLNTALYMGNSMGFLGAIYNASSVPAIIGWDVVTTDYFHPRCYPSYLFWNPLTTATNVTFNFGTTNCDLYDAVSGVFVARNVQGNYAFTMGADQAMVLVVAPTDGVISQVGTQLRINGVVVDYRNHGNGLLGEFFNNFSQTNRVLARTDAQLNFAWGGGSPDPIVSSNNFSARWSGWLVPQYSQTYTLSTVSSNNVRLWINDQLQINNWGVGPVSNACQVALVANQPAAIRLDYASSGTNSGVQLFWSSPSLAAGLIPSDRLMPVLGTGLQAEYFDSTGLTNLVMVRTDGTINFNWTNNAPVSLLSSSNLSVRWTGWLVPKYTETNTLTLLASQGARLWINNQLLVDSWNTQVPSNTVQVLLTNSLPVAVRLELFGGGPVPTSQRYEAESGQLLGGAAVATQANASGGQAVNLNSSGKGVQFNSVVATTNLVIRYSCGSVLGGNCSLYTNGVLLVNKSLSWTGSSSTFTSVSFNQNIPAGTILKIIYNNVSFYLDYLTLNGSVMSASQSLASLSWSSPSQPSPEIVPAEQWLPPVGNGLAGEYFNRTGLTSRALMRTDAQVNFNWNGVAPDPAIYSNQFSVRWSGWLLPRYSETYTLTTATRDGVRLWLNDQLVINNWVSGAQTNTCTVALTAGKLAKIRMESFNSSGNGLAQLSWSSPSQALEVIPQSQLIGPSAPPQPASAAVAPPNLPPLLPPISDQSIHALSLLNLTASASDLDLPPQTLTYSLDPGAPSGASINPATGLFSWTPSLAQYPGVYTVTLRVTDNGNPPLSATNTFNVTVTAPAPVVTETDLSFISGIFAPLATNDLILGNPGDASALNYNYNGYNYGGWTPANLTDGNLGLIGLCNEGCGGPISLISGGTVIYNLGGGANSTGYTITGIRTTVWWTGGGRDNQKYTVSYSLDGTNYAALATVNYNADQNGAVNASDVSLAIAGLSNVRSIQFYFPGQENAAVGYSELAVFGKSSRGTNIAPTQLVLSSSANPSLLGTNVIFTATVSTNGVTAGDAISNVVFQVDGTVVFTNAVVSGSATYANNTLALGAHSLTAIYRGDLNYAASTNTLTQSIYPAPVVTETDLSLTNGSFAPLATNDLVLGNAGVAALTTVTFTGTATNLTDGVLQAPGSPGTSAQIVMIQSGTVTYNLGNGCNITGIRSLTAWSNGTRINPKYTVSYSWDGTNYLPLATVNYAAPSTAKGTDVALAITGLTNVVSLQFSFPNSQQNSGVAYSELAVLGTATPVVKPNLSAQLLSPGMTNLVLNLSGLVAGQSYTLQSSPSLSPAVWSNAAPFVATQATSAITNATGTNTMQFYRLKY